MECETHNSRIIPVLTYGYLILPFVIFAIGWMRIYIWIPVVIAVLFSTWKAWKDTPPFWYPRFTQDNVVKIAFICLTLIIWVFYSGIGGKVMQNSDHPYRNAIFEALVSHTWPVYNQNILPGTYPEGTSLTAMVYYIGFWLPAAVIGKIFGLQAGYNFQMIWALAGVFLTYYYICERKNKLVVWPLLLLIFFSGMDIVGMYLIGQNVFTIANDAHMEWWMGPYQYSSMTTQLFWVFNQAVPAWLCTAFAMRQTNNRSMVFILAASMLPSTFPFVGLIPFVAFWMLSRNYKLPNEGSHIGNIKKWTATFLKDSLTLQNVVGGGVIGIFSYLYLRGSVSATNIGSQGMTSILDSINLARCLIFIIVEVGIYLILVYQYNNKGIFFVTSLSLILIPMLKGSSGDFCMRVSIPALFVLMLLVQDTLEKAERKRDFLVLGSLIAVLCIGSITPIHEIARTIRNTVEYQNSGTEFRNTVPEEKILNGANFSGSVNNNFFFQYVAKEP